MLWISISKCCFILLWNGKWEWFCHCSFNVVNLIILIMKITISLKPIFSHGAQEHFLTTNICEKIWRTKHGNHYNSQYPRRRAPWERCLQVEGDSSVTYKSKAEAEEWEILWDVVVQKGSEHAPYFTSIFHMNLVQDFCDTSLCRKTLWAGGGSALFQYISYMFASKLIATTSQHLPSNVLTNINSFCCTSVLSFSLKE